MKLNKNYAMFFLMLSVHKCKQLYLKSIVIYRENKIYQLQSSWNQHYRHATNIGYQWTQNMRKQYEFQGFNKSYAEIRILLPVQVPYLKKKHYIRVQNISIFSFILFFIGTFII